ncbi:hypothetical protein Trydic_g4632 [Trypoxylus dichotomus]
MTKALTNPRRRSNIPPLTTSEGQAITPKEKAEAFANTLSDTFKPNPSNVKLQYLHCHIDDKSRTATFTGEETVPATKCEIEALLKNLKRKKSTGHDGITSEAIKNLPSEGMAAITDIINAILKLGHFPDTWKEAKVIMIRKPGKPSNDTNSYRPISLLPIISKIAERVILNRLNEATEELGIIPHHQLGFREGHSTTHQLVRLIEHITEKMNISTPTAAIFLDVEKAFDRVWHAGLVHKMARARIPGPLIQLVRHYLTNRKFHVVVENEGSSTRLIKAGVPQGSVLGPHLFNLYMYDIPTLAHSKVTQFADDTAIYLSNRNRKHITMRLQEDIDALIKYFHAWRIKINPSKSTAVFFQGRRTHKIPEQISIEGLPIPWSKQAKYLGVMLDESLTYKHHAANIRKKIGASAHALYPLLNPKSKLSLENRIKLVKTIITPIATYAGEVRHQASSSAKHAVQSKLNNIIRLAARAPRFMSNIRLLKELKLPTLEEAIVKRATQTIAKIQTHRNPLIKECIKVRKTTSKRKGILMITNEVEG